MPVAADTAMIASELRGVIGRLVRRLRAEHRFPLSHGAVLGRLDREGAASVSDLASREGVKPQSMAQTVGDLEGEGLVSRRPDPADGRRILVELTEAGTSALQADRAPPRGVAGDGHLRAALPRGAAAARAGRRAAEADLRELASGRPCRPSTAGRYSAGSVRGRPKRLKTPESVKPVSAEMRSPSSVSTVRTLAWETAPWGSAT